mgnify:CR=1 FL=1
MIRRPCSTKIVLLALLWLQGCGWDPVQAPQTPPPVVPPLAPPNAPPPPIPDRPYTRIVSFDTLLLFPGERRFAKAGLWTESGPPSGTWSSDDSTIVAIAWQAPWAAQLNLMRSGTTTIRVRVPDTVLTLSVRVQPEPATTADVRVERLVALGGFDGEDETSWAPRVELRAAAGLAGWGVVALQFDMPDTRPTVTCIGNEAPLTAGASLTLTPTQFQFYNGYQSPPIGAPVRVRTILRDASGVLRSVIGNGVSTRAAGVLATGVDSRGWTCR